MRQRIGKRNVHGNAENTVDTAVVYRLPFPGSKITTEDPVFLFCHGQLQLFDRLCKTGPHFPCGLPLFHRNPRRFQNFFNRKKLFQIPVCGSKIGESCGEKLREGKIPSDFVVDIFLCRRLIVHNSTLNIRFESLRVRVRADRKQGVVDLKKIKIKFGHKKSPEKS